MKLEISKEKNPVQWALDMAGKTEDTGSQGVMRALESIL